jgi:hypothetical protein
MDCQICLRELEPLEPVYRMGLGPAINNGLPPQYVKDVLML